jgi:hypothetical protein
MLLSFYDDDDDVVVLFIFFMALVDPAADCDRLLGSEVGLKDASV